MASTITYENIRGPLVLDRYELLERIGTGGFSTVYRARDHKMGRDVAVKAVRRTEELSDRATREARAAAQLGHPHIMTVFELAEDDDDVYIVSELVRGETLTCRIADGSLSDRDCLDIALQVLDALDHAHDRGVIHRDIKPDNIMLAGEKPLRIKVMDFGIAQLENTQRLTRQGDVVGTISYMSPEQADGFTVDSATDVYSTALTLYECLSGSHPFRGGTAAEIVGRIQAGAPPLSQARPDLPHDLTDLLDEAMEPDPRLRIGLKSFVVGLEEILPELSPDDRATTVLRRADQSRPSAYQDLAEQYGYVAARTANGILAALLGWVAIYGTDLYPAPWRLPLLLASALAVALLPRVGLAALLAIAVATVYGFSIGSAILLTPLAIGYFLIFGLLWPRTALLPVLAAALGTVGLGLAYPGISGAAGRLRSGLALAAVGAATLGIYQLVSGDDPLDYLGLPNVYNVHSELAGENNPVGVLKALAAPFEAQPILLMQPVIWLAAAVPAALLFTRRRLFMDISGLLLANGIIAGGYFALPFVFPDYRLPVSAFLKTFLLCVIIQFGLLLLSPRNSRQPLSPP
ncbi:MAG: serine/threonine protein kinase [Actinobacteria bacterium]|nr:serine/threonine protein kinase [Actinomycetota bacterium]